jgi:hypothetical protein
MFGNTDPQILKDSYATLHVCTYLGRPGTRIIDAKWITNVVAMVPFKHIQREINYFEGKRYFAVERMSAASIGRIHDEGDDVDKEM